MRIYCDIDGTLTRDPLHRDGEPILENINKIKELISKGHKLIIWSMGGTKYAKKFCEKYDIKPFLCIGKPHVIIDDCKTIRPSGYMTYITPEEITMWGETKNNNWMK